MFIEQKISLLNWFLKTNDAENSDLISEINYIWTDIHIEIT